jgi:hypothetical protein
MAGKLARSECNRTLLDMAKEKDNRARGAATNRAQMEKDWLKAWRELSREQIQKWIEAISAYIEQVCLLDGGNERKAGYYSKGAGQGVGLKVNSLPTAIWRRRRIRTTRWMTILKM